MIPPFVILFSPTHSTEVWVDRWAVHGRLVVNIESIVLLRAVRTFIMPSYVHSNVQCALRNNAAVKSPWWPDDYSWAILSTDHSHCFLDRLGEHPSDSLSSGLKLSRTSATTTCQYSGVIIGACFTLLLLFVDALTLLLTRELPQNVTHSALAVF